MKKIVIAMLLMLPLIIVASVLFSANIISVNVYIAVESVQLNAGDMLTLPLNKGEYQFHATVYPTGARNKGVYFEIENYECFGDDVADAVTIDQTGLVKFKTYCAFDVVVTTEEGYKMDRCNVIIESGEIEGVSIAIDNYTVMTGESILIKPLFNPVDGQTDNLEWHSDNPSVLRVDDNGIITALTEGSANITVKVSESIFDTKTFTIKKGVTKYGAKFNASRDFNLSEIEPLDAVSAISGCKIENGFLKFTENIAIIKVGNELVRISHCQNGDIEIEHKDILLQNYLKLGGIPIYLNVVYSDIFASGKPSVTYKTNDPLVATIDQTGKTTAVGRGEVTFRAECEDRFVSIDLSVIQEIKYLRLNTIDSHDKKGIANTCVYGNRIYKDGNFAAYTLELGINYPLNASWEDFQISINDDSVAYVDGNKIVFKENIEGMKNFVITVKAKYSAYQNVSVTARRNLKIINAVNCSSYEEMYCASEAKMSICMLNNIALTESHKPLKLYGSLYGNGCMLDGIKLRKEAEEPLVNVLADNVTVSNVHIRCDDIVKINLANGMSGCALSIGILEQAERFTNINLEYLILGESYYGLTMHNSDVKMKGCIIRNTSNFGIFLPSNYNKLNADLCDYSNLYMNNCVMSNIVATAMGIATNAKLPNGDTLPKQSNLYSTGFLDIYNWQDITSARMLDRTIIEEDENFDLLVKNLINKALGNEVKKDNYKDIRHTVDNKHYIHLGIITAGAIYENKSIIDIEDERFITFPIEALDQVAGLAKILNFDFYPCTLYIYDNKSNISVKDDFSENKWSYKRLRGEEGI